MDTLKKYIIVGIIDILVMVAFAFWREAFSMPDASHVYHILSDGFFTLGVLNLGIGTLIWVSNEGFFDMLNYGMRSFWGFFFKDLNKYADFQDYKEEKHKSHFSFFHFVIYGVLFIALAYVFLKLI